MFKALYNHVNNIIEKYLQIYYHILIYLQWIKKEKLKLKQLLNHIHNDKKREKIKTIYNGQWVERPTLLHVYSSYFCFELNITKLTITWLWRLDFSSFLLIVKFLLHNDKDASTFSHLDAKDWYLTSAGLRLACKKGFINHFSITDSQ